MRFHSCTVVVDVEEDGNDDRLVDVEVLFIAMNLVECSFACQIGEARSRLHCYEALRLKILNRDAQDVEKGRWVRVPDGVVVVRREVVGQYAWCLVVHPSEVWCTVWCDSWA